MTTNPMTSDAAERSNPAVARPAPAVDRDSAPYWDGLRRHQLLLQRCSSCGTRRWPARAICPRCLSWDAEWIAAAGRATLVTWTVVRHPIGKAFTERVPYVVARVRPVDAPEVLLAGDVVECTHESLVAGMELEAVFDDVSPELTLLDWRPVEERVDRRTGDGAEPQS